MPVGEEHGLPRGSPAEAGLLDVREVVSRLQETNFYVDEALLRTVFDKWLRE